MAIAIVGKWCVYDGNFGGIPMYNRAIARGYCSLGNNVVLITAKWDARLPDKTVIDHHTTIVRVPIPRIPSRLMRSLMGGHFRLLESLIISKRLSIALRKMINAGQIDAAEFAEASIDAYHSVGRIPVPHLVRCHTPLSLLRTYYDPADFKYPLITLLMEKAIISRAPVLTTPSEDLKKQVTALFGVSEDKITTVANPVEADVYKPAENLVSRPVPVVLHVGRLDARKGATVLGEAAPMILEKFPQTRLVFAGQDRRTPAGMGITHYIQSNCSSDIQCNLHFEGEVSEECLVELYGKADVCVVPSMIYESFSYTAAQAMSCGRPVVASRIGGIPEVVADGRTGFLIPPGDAKALAQEVCRLLEDDELRKRMGLAGRERVTDMFDPKSLAKRNLETLGLG